MPDTSGSSALLTRYKSSGGDLQPVLLIHGYSASGTTFVHRSLPGGGLAGALCRAGFDVWVLDMRSSSGFETSRKPWVFEQMAYQDIPMAVDFIRRETGYKRLDVVAHCMGAAMLSIGLLADRPIGEEYDLVPVQRAAMRSGLRRIVFSQVAPAVVMSPANTARAYLFAWLRHYVKLDVYELRPAVRTFASDLLDRLLCAVPYPEEDFHRENPLWPLGKLAPWVATRHRMDALFGETFKLANMAPEVLNAIDEFFGPIHLKTTSQVIAFARECVVTDSEGNGSFVNPASLARLGDVRVLGLHSEKNGLADYRTRGHLLRLMSATGLAGSSTSLGPIGHQDSLIGRKAQDTYDHIIRFLGEA
jgi:pimeloyl-ACP methyl ester carboxylesterase